MHNLTFDLIAHREGGHSRLSGFVTTFALHKFEQLLIVWGHVANIPTPALQAGAYANSATIQTYWTERFELS